MNFIGQTIIVELILIILLLCTLCLLHVVRIKKMIWSKISKYRNKIKKHFYLAIRNPAVYYMHSRKPVDTNKVIFIEVTQTSLSNNYQLLYERLQRDYDFNLEVYFLKRTTVPDKEYQKRCKTVVAQMATAAYIFMDDGCNAFGRIKFRKETRIYNLWHGCGAFKRFGFGTADLIFGDSRKEQKKYPTYTYCDNFFVSSPEVVWAYSEATGLEREKILPLGVSRTDIFFDKDFAAAAREKIDRIMPSARGKKIILFAPTFRGRIKKATTATAFSVPIFFNALSDEYVLAIKHHPHVKTRPKIARPYRDFAVDFTKLMSIEELLCVADICISDYSSLVFEYSLLERPMLFFAYDIDKYEDWRGFFYDYEEMTPGPICKRNAEMIEYIQHIDTCFDRQRVIDFREKFMSACDGHSTDRILQTVFGDALQLHQKNVEDHEEVPV